ncbi:MAG: cytochrome-c peroxidase [Chloroflexota bacterium]|nr:cytochrome-c peroxidase [Chloroflexota bacterium]
MRRTPLLYTVLMVELIVGVILLYNFTYLSALLRQNIALTPAVTTPTVVVNLPVVLSAPSSTAVLSTTQPLVLVELSPAILSVFAALPAEAVPNNYEITEALVTLGRTLFYDPRLSATQDMSCNTCHLLERYGTDGLPVSLGHDGKPVKRNSPTVYNAAFHIAQFWDGRAATVEEQAKMPVVAQGEMGLTDGDRVDEVLRSIPGYASLFSAAFPSDSNPVGFENSSIAIGAFERRLTLASRFDRFLAGDRTQLNGDEQRGLATFITVGCPQCHMGMTVGGLLYKKIGQIVPFATEDTGRFMVTGLEEDRYVFKVPSLRNVAKTGPYMHDGKIQTLEEMVRIMARHQLGKTVSDAQVVDVVTFLNALTGELPTAYITPPQLPLSGPDTPRPKRVN